MKNFKFRNLTNMMKLKYSFKFTDLKKIIFKTSKNLLKISFVSLFLFSTINILPLIAGNENNSNSVNAQTSTIPQWGEPGNMPTRENYKSLSTNNIIKSGISIKWQLHNTGIATPGYTDNSGNTAKMEWQDPFIAADGTLYTIGTEYSGTNVTNGTNTSYLYAIDPATGNPKWNRYLLTIPRNCEQTPKLQTTTFQSAWHIAGILPTGDIVTWVAESHSCWTGTYNNNTATLQVLRLSSGPSTAIQTSRYFAAGDGSTNTWDIGGIYQYSNQDVYYVSVGQYLSKHYTLYTIQKDPAGQWSVDPNWAASCSGQCPHNDGFYTQVVMNSAKTLAFASDDTVASENVLSNSSLNQSIKTNFGGGYSTLVTPVTFNWGAGKETDERMIIGSGTTGYIMFLKQPASTFPSNTDVYQEADAFRGQLLGVDKSTNSLITNPQVNGYLRKINLNDPTITNYYGTCGAGKGYGSNAHGILVNNCNVNVPYSTLSLEGNTLIDSVVMSGYIYYTVRVNGTNTVRFYARSLSDFTTPPNNTPVPPAPLARLDVTAHPVVIHYHEFGKLAVGDNGQVYMSNGNQIVAFGPVNLTATINGTLGTQLNKNTITANIGDTVKLNGNLTNSQFGAFLNLSNSTFILGSSNTYIQTDPNCTVSPTTTCSISVNLKIDPTYSPGQSIYIAIESYAKINTNINITRADNTILKCSGIFNYNNTSPTSPWNKCDNTSLDYMVIKIADRPPTGTLTATANPGPVLVDNNGLRRIKVYQNTPVSFTYRMLDADGNLGGTDGITGRLYKQNGTGWDLMNTTANSSCSNKSDCTSAPWSWSTNGLPINSSYLFVVNVYDSSNSFCTGNPNPGIYSKCDSSTPARLDALWVDIIPVPAWFNTKNSQTYSQKSFQGTMQNNDMNTNILAVSNPFSDNIFTSATALVNFYKVNTTDTTPLITAYGNPNPSNPIWNYHDSNTSSDGSNIKNFLDNIVSNKIKCVDLTVTNNSDPCFNNQSSSIKLNPDNSIGIQLSSLPYNQTTDPNNIGVVYNLKNIGNNDIKINYDLSSNSLKSGVIIYANYDDGSTGNVNIDISNLGASNDTSYLNNSVVIVTNKPITVNIPDGSKNNNKFYYNLGLISDKNVTYKCTSNCSNVHSYQNGFVFTNSKINIQLQNTDTTLNPAFQVSYVPSYFFDFQNIFTGLNISTTFLGYDF